MSYEPPFTANATILNLVGDISEKMGKLSAHSELSAENSNVKLRRINRIRTIHGSLAIEGNTLSEEQITAILAGKKVLAPPREIKEAQNAIELYEHLNDFSAHSKKDLLKAHKILMIDLIKEAGKFRSGGAGVMKGEQLVHMAPAASMVPGQIKDLLAWLKHSKDHPLVKSSVFHYEFEFIHPFADGNGRMGRLWQTLILSKWKPEFAYIPVENMVHLHQKEYYQAINQSSQIADSAPFVEFMLKRILEAVLELTDSSTMKATTEVAMGVTTEVAMLLKVLKNEMTRQELQKELGLRNAEHFRKSYLVPALKVGAVERTIPDKPNSRLQKYRLTEKGALLVEKMR